LTDVIDSQQQVNCDTIKMQVTHIRQGVKTLIQELGGQYPNLADYLQDYLNDPQIREQIFNIGIEGFVEKGRGVVVVDLRKSTGNVVRYYYLSAGKSGQWQDAEMERVCQSYNPDKEVIVFLFFGEFSSKNYSYKIAAQ